MIFDELTFENSTGSCVDSNFSTVAERDRKMRSKHRVRKMYTKVQVTGSCLLLRIITWLNGMVLFSLYLNFDDFALTLLLHHG